MECRRDHQVHGGGASPRPPIWTDLGVNLQSLCLSLPLGWGGILIGEPHPFPSGQEPQTTLRRQADPTLQERRIRSWEAGCGPPTGSWENWGNPHLQLGTFQSQGLDPDLGQVPPEPSLPTLTAPHPQVGAGALKTLRMSPSCGGHSR